MHQSRMRTTILIESILLPTLVEYMAEIYCSKPYCDITVVAKEKQSGHLTPRCVYLLIINSVSSW